MTPEERLDASAEVLAKGFLAIAEEDPEMKWLKDAARGLDIASILVYT